MRTLRFSSFGRMASCRSACAGGRAPTGLLAVVTILAALILSMGLPAGALAEEGGSYTLQCFCPLEWEEPWDGQGVFDEDASLDTVALANDGAVLLIHEIPLTDGDLDGLIADRTDSLERAAAIDNLDEQVIDAGQEDWILMGRSWTGPSGESMLGAQHVQVWETDFLLSIEFIAPEDEFVDAWDELDLVLLIGEPILAEFDGADVADDIGAGR